MGRRLTTQEQKVLDTWQKEKLDTADIAGGRVVAFFKQIRSIID